MKRRRIVSKQKSNFQIVLSFNLCHELFSNAFQLKMFHVYMLGLSNGLCEHASGMFIFASTSSYQIFLASSEHFRKIQMASNEHFEYFVNFPLARISLLLIG